MRFFEPEIRWLKAAYEFLRHQWEPITAIAALFVAALSAWYTYEGQREASFVSKLSRMPLVMIDMDRSSFKIQNIGPGPGIVYEAHLRFGDEELLLKISDDTRVNQQKMNDFRELVFSKKLLSQPLAARVPVGPVKADADVAFIEAPGGDADFAKISPVLSITLCTVDVTGKMFGVSSLSLPGDQFKCSEDHPGVVSDSP